MRLLVTLFALESYPNDLHEWFIQETIDTYDDLRYYFYKIVARLDSKGTLNGVKCRTENVARMMLDIEEIVVVKDDEGQHFDGPVEEDDDQINSFYFYRPGIRMSYVTLCFFFC